MFEIALKQNDYPTYILSDKTVNARLEVVPERGGIITAWRLQGQDLLYFDAERFANPELSIRGGIPILFPICGNLPNSLYVHQGQSYQLKQHGFARDLPWTVRDRSTIDGASLTLALTSTEQTLASYPFEFELQFTYRLKGNTLTIKQLFTNQSAQSMPFSTGLHPYFLTTDKTALTFEIASNQWQNQIDQTINPFNGSFDLESEEIDAAFFPVNRSQSSLVSDSRNHRIMITYSELYKGIVFWTVKGKDYCCLEPWSAPRNALNSKEYLTYLEAGESCQATVELSVSYLQSSKP
ncbi:MAG: aldose epimerase [Spirulina sp. SIO3F2]|nr:aldose epimerase [Spirulina sp. SIO3F2]